MNDALRDISRIGLGAWAIGGPYQYGWGPVDDSESEATIVRATEYGLSWVDTAPPYGYGHSEEVVGNAITKMPGPRPMIFTKCGRVWNNEGIVSSDLRPQSIREQWHQSIKRLKTDVIDVYQIHRPDTVTGTPLEESWAELAHLKKEGKVRAIGLCNVSAEEYRQCAAIEQVDCLQLPVNLMRPGNATLRETATKDGAIVLAYSPMESGLLTGTFDATRVDNLPDDDWRKRSPKFNAAALEKASILLGHVKSIEERSGYSIPEIALAWVLRQPGVTAAIVGARFPKQLDAWLNADKVDLPDSEWQALDQAVRVYA